jgi:hypothetical protein
MDKSEAPSLWVFTVAVLLAAVSVVCLLWLLRSFEFLPYATFVPRYVPEVTTATAQLADAPVRRRATDGVTLFISDGLRLDTSRSLPAWEALRAEGADAVTHAVFPTFTRVGFATMLTGVGPRLHGYLSNYNKRPSPVPSVIDAARKAGVRTRLLAGAPNTLPLQFPDAFEEIAALEPASLSGGPRPHLTVIYVHEPDQTSHTDGATSEAGLRAAAWAGEQLGRVRAQLDLARETLIAVTDHGHLDGGGHGGHEDVVRQIPLVLAGAGVRRGARLEAAAGSDLRDVAATIAELLGLAPIPGATGRPLYEVMASPPETRIERQVEAPDAPPGAPWARAMTTAAALVLIPFLLLRPRGWRAFLGTFVAIGVFYGLYALRGHPWSFSCVNNEADVPGFMLEVLLLACAAALTGAVVAGSVRRYGAGVICVTAALAGATWGFAGIGAPAALDQPAAAYQAYLGLTNLLGTSLVVAALLALGARWRREEASAIEVLDG